MKHPDFVLTRVNGVLVSCGKLQLASDFMTFIDRLFGSGMRFRGLDYAVFSSLLYDEDWLAVQRSKNTEIKLANGILRFEPQRQSLYRPVKLLESNKRADYVFEPVSIEVSYEEPVYSEPDENGVSEIVEYAQKVRREPASLDFDEFVADMWQKDVRFGIDAGEVRQIISSGKTVRTTIARHSEPTEGRDAEIVEVCPDLHRDNSPKILANGGVDLRVFKNRFPQMAKGTRLIRKIPRVLGKPGYKVTGDPIEPEMPKDIDFHTLASIGTKIEQFPDGEYIVSTLDGFLMLDTKTNQMAVTEKIENKGGISVKTTGDLALSVNEFVEHGEVQEGREVKGVHMTFLSDVFGDVTSQGGNIRIDGCLAGGVAESHGGNVQLTGRGSRSRVRAQDGEVTAGFCESCTLIGKVVRVEHAVNCEIVADEVHAGEVEGCVIAGKIIEIGAAGERRGRETLLTALIPDLAPFDLRISQLKKDITDGRVRLDDKLRQTEQVKSDADYAKYLALAERIKSGAIQLTDEQAGNWRKLAEKNAPSDNLLSQIQDEIDKLENAVKGMEEELSYTENARDLAGQNIYIEVGKVTGHTVGQTMKQGGDMAALDTMSGDDIRAVMQKMDSRKQRIFVGEKGSVQWRYMVPGA
ncbi:MAG: flagellar assembly protein A [Gallionella sp.]|nr:flagellar assembly protein A [Gallionella sp.]